MKRARAALKGPTAIQGEDVARAPKPGLKERSRLEQVHVNEELSKTDRSFIRDLLTMPVCFSTANISMHSAGEKKACHEKMVWLIVMFSRIRVCTFSPSSQSTRWQQKAELALKDSDGSGVPPNLQLPGPRRQPYRRQPGGLAHSPVTLKTNG